MGVEAEPGEGKREYADPEPERRPAGGGEVGMEAAAGAVSAADGANIIS